MISQAYAGMIALVALIAISATVAMMMAVAWFDLGRARHARTWSIAFTVGTGAWGCGVLQGLGVVTPGVAAIVMPGMAGFAVALIAVGFRQRVGLPDGYRTLLALAMAHALLVFGLTGIVGTEAWIAPLAIFNTAMFGAASRTLRGRRQSERMAERMTEGGMVLLALFNILVLAAVAGMWAGLLRFDLDRIELLVLVLLPALVTGIGLFTIILLTADLADRTRRMAATDILTGLLNRRGFENTARAMLATTKRHRRAMVLVMIDVDCFKQINDLFGHPAGDRVLKQVSARLSDAISRRDLLARIGGEEFALLMTDVDIQAACCAVEVLRLQVETMQVDLPEAHRVTASFGIAAADGPDDDLDRLLERADRALYESKENGRNRATVAVSGTAAR